MPRPELIRLNKSPIENNVYWYESETDGVHRCIQILPVPIVPNV